MNIVSQTQWTGWFTGTGEGGNLVQNEINAIMPWIVGFIGIACAIAIGMCWWLMLHADGPEARKHVRTKLIWVLIAGAMLFVAPSLFLLLLNTMGKAAQVSTGQSANTTANPSLITHYITLEIPNLFTKV